jgi:hypothetical protein
MASREPQTHRAIDRCLLRRPIIFYPSPTLRTICVLPSTAGGTHGATSVLRAIVDMKNEIRRREEYDRDHGVPAHTRATQIELAATSTNSPVQRQ